MTEEAKKLNWCYSLSAGFQSVIMMLYQRYSLLIKRCWSSDTDQVLPGTRDDAGKRSRSKHFRSLTIEEVEKCMGFTSMYVGKFFDRTDSGKRNAWALLGQSFSIQVVSRLLAPLRTMYKVKQYKEYTNKPFPGEKELWQWSSWLWHAQVLNKFFLKTTMIEDPAFFEEEGNRRGLHRSPKSRSPVFSYVGRYVCVW